MDFEPGVSLVIGTFRPLRERDIPAGARALVGCRLSFYAGWQLDAGDYAGQWALTPAFPSTLGWIPLCDLTEVEIII